MFENWTFLLGEIWVLLVLAGLLGLLAGWIIWGRSAHLEASNPKAVVEGPPRLKGPRNGGADDLTQIKGIGPKLAVLCNGIGFYHFDQIASWNEAEIAWMDENLEGFKGRVTRDNWVPQAKALIK